MNTTIIGRNCTPRDDFKARAEKKLAKIERIFGSDIDVKVTAIVEKKNKAVEITVAKDSLIFRAEERSAELIDALDACVDSLIRQIRKNKTRVEKKLRGGNFEALAAEAPEAVDEESDYEVVRRKKIELVPLSVDEAILQMNIVGHQFYMFLDAETGLVSVVYARKDGGYGVIAGDNA